MTVVAYRQIRYRLLPGKASAYRSLDRMLEDQRQLYNASLEERIDCYRKTGKTLTYHDQCRALTGCRREIPEMRACPTAIQRGTLKRLDEAFRGFFRRAKERKGKAGFPGFRGRRRFDSFSIVQRVKVRDGCLWISRELPVPLRRRGENPYPDGKPLTAVLKKGRAGSGLRPSATEWRPKPLPMTAGPSALT